MSVLESIASSRRKTKENVRLEGLIPEQLREDAELLKEMMSSYYEFMNLFGHYYKRKEVHHYATVINGEILFRADSNNYFYDVNFEESKLYDSKGNEITINPYQAYILGTDNLPDVLADDETTYGTLFQIEDPEILNYDFQQLLLVTPVIVHVGDSPSHVMNTVLEQRDIDTIRSKYLEMIQREIAASIPRALQSDKKLLYKNITQFYRERGSEESIKVFFQILLNDQVEIKYPYNDVLIPSSGDWDPDSPSVSPVYDELGNIISYEETLGRYLDNNGFLSDKKKIQDSYFYQKFAYLIRTGSNITTWENAFNKLIHPAGFKFFGEIVMFIELINQRNSIMPLYQPGFIGAEDIALLFSFFASLSTPQFDVKIHRSARLGDFKVTAGVIDYVEIIDGGYGYTVAPTINVVDSTGVNVSFTLSIDSNGTIIPDGITASGVNYVVPSVGGSGYTAPSATIDANPNAGSVATITLLSSGYKYTGSVDVVFDDSLFDTTAIGTAILENGRVVGINLTDAGSGYQEDPKVYIVPQEGVKRDRVAEFLPILILAFENDNKYFKEIDERWKDLLHFYDNTPIYAYADFTFEGLELDEFNVYQNVGTEIYNQHNLLNPIAFNDIETKIAQDHI